jgi:hypothetical protein
LHASGQGRDGRGLWFEKLWQRIVYFEHYERHVLRSRSNSPIREAGENFSSDIGSVSAAVLAAILLRSSTPKRMAIRIETCSQKTRVRIPPEVATKSISCKCLVKRWFNGPTCLYIGPKVASENFPELLLARQIPSIAWGFAH